MVEKQDGMRPRGDHVCDRVEMKLHGLLVAGCQHETGAGTVDWVR